MTPSRFLRATSNPGVITSFPSAPRPPRPPKNPLLQPLPLYRLILRAHRTLPPSLRTIGDPYVKSEFHLHATTENPIHIVGFLSEWQKYAQELVGDKWRGGKIDKEKVEKMSEEQVGQLYALMKATREQDQVGDEEGSGEGEVEGDARKKREVEESNELIDRITQKP